MVLTRPEKSTAVPVVGPPVDANAGGFFAAGAGESVLVSIVAVATSTGLLLPVGPQSGPADEYRERAFAPAVEETVIRVVEVEVGCFASFSWEEKSLCGTHLSLFVSC